ncbi:Serine/threonine-protein kinase-like protein ACR4 [Hordeum vulgare]|nr:Serine/threonine-protein kinase-like protein ACR4 [Hordeum vulgare]
MYDLMEDEMGVFTSMSETIKEVANTTRESKSVDVYPDLYTIIIDQVQQQKLHIEIEDILEKEEPYWMQRGRADWLAKGDQNTGFFHRAANGRKKRNAIMKIKEPNGDWVEELDDSGIGSTGAVLRSNKGVFIAGSCSDIPFAEDASSVEARALQDGLLLASEVGVQQIIVESDYQNVVDTMLLDGNSLGLAATVYEECSFLAKNFSLIQFVFCPREANIVAHTLARISRGREGEEGDKKVLRHGFSVWSCSCAWREMTPPDLVNPQVNYLSSIHHHRNLVNLLGYCQDNGMQMLVYQYVPNGSISTHLHGNGHSPTVRLEFKQRLAIAHGTAKGLSHLHSMTPPAVHMNFKTANVLVDADFVPKVADTGIRGLLDRLGNAGPPSMIFDDPFVDPRGKESMIFSIQSDVYSFGVFIVELISGRTAASDQGIVEWVRNFQESSDISAIADRRMTSVFTSLGLKELLRLASRCVNPASENRPSMSLVEAEIHRIHEQEIGMTTIMPQGNTTVALGSQLFTSSR